MDFTKICRICLASSKETFDIFNSYDAKINTSYSQMLSDCTKLQPKFDDGLPRLICEECSRQLKQSFSFNLKCEESDRRLRCYLETVNAFKDDINSLKSKIKYEDEDNTDNSVGQSVIVDYVVVSVLEGSNEVKNDMVKSEPSEHENGEDSCWDAEDDNIILEKIKTKKTLDDPDSEGNKIKIKKKRGRRKRVFPEGGEAQLRSLPESKLSHQCDVCGKFLSTKSNLKAHKLCHSDQRPYQCNLCPAAFKGYSALFQHKRVHTGETPYHCEYCPKQFSRRTGLINHIRIHTGEKLFSCEICFKNFIQHAQLSIHMKRHKGEKSYLCQDCGKGFPIKADLKVHQRIHNGEKPYSCHLCPKTFATSGNLSIHVRIHNKEIRYNCEECLRGFVTCSAYNVHMKRHKGQRDYHCECGKTFFTSSALKQHKVVHTGEKRYQCKICERKFSQTSHLSRHFKRDHMKPNAPVPSSTHYKVVIRDGHKNMLNVLDGMQKSTDNVSSDVKCENS